MSSMLVQLAVDVNHHVTITTLSGSESRGQVIVVETVEGAHAVCALNYARAMALLTLPMDVDPRLVAITDQLGALCEELVR